MLFGQDGAHAADDAGSVGKGLDHVGAASGLVDEALVGIVGPEWRQASLGNVVNARLSAGAPFQVHGNLGQLFSQAFDDAVELGVPPRAGRRSSAIVALPSPTTSSGRGHQLCRPDFRG